MWPQKPTSKPSVLLLQSYLAPQKPEGIWGQEISISAKCFWSCARKLSHEEPVSTMSPTCTWSVVISTSKAAPLPSWSSAPRHITSPSRLHTPSHGEEWPKECFKVCSHLPFLESHSWRQENLSETCGNIKLADCENPAEFPPSHPHPRLLTSFPRGQMGS